MAVKSTYCFCLGPGLLVSSHVVTRPSTTQLGHLMLSSDLCRRQAFICAYTCAGKASMHIKINASQKKRNILVFPFNCGFMVTGLYVLHGLVCVLSQQWHKSRGDGCLLYLWNLTRTGRKGAGELTWPETVLRALCAAVGQVVK